MKTPNFELELQPTDTKDEVFSNVASFISKLGLSVNSVDNQRPWGGFFVINPEQTEEFAELFFPGKTMAELTAYGSTLSPKVLVVEPKQRLSWQYHHRRAEIWNTIHGPTGVITSQDDTQGKVQVLNEGDVLQLDHLTRHRLIGLDGWGVVAEIWQHTDPNNPSDEEDIVRVQDDFGR